MSQVRLQKYLADAGLGSRRACEAIILAGRVFVNGHLVRQLGTKILPGKDRVTVDDAPTQARKKVYIALHKPRGVLCSRRDDAAQVTPRPSRRGDAPRSSPRSRTSNAEAGADALTGKSRSNAPKALVHELLPPGWSHLQTVGRLDLDSEGLILLTNDGAFSNRVAHPRYGARKTYRVEVGGRFPVDELPKLTKGVRSRGEWLRALSANLLSANNTRSRLELTLSEGKNREVRRLFAAVGFRVQRLQRIQVGPIKLGELPVGKWRTLTESEINSLLPPL